MPEPREPAGVTDLRVRVSSGLSEAAPEDVFVLMLHLANPRPPAADDTYLVTFSRLAVPTAANDLIQIGRERLFVPPAAITEVVTISLRTPWERSRDDLEAAVAEAFRRLIEESATSPDAAVDHDTAIAASLALVCDVVPAARPSEVSIRAEEHQAGRWAVRLSTPAPAGPTEFEVHVGFVDGHSGAMHLRRTPPPEVVDSIGPA